ALPLPSVLRSMKVSTRVVRRICIVSIIGALLYFFTPLRGLWRSTAHFHSSKLDPRVRFETGTEKLAEHVAAALPGTIAADARNTCGIGSRNCWSDSFATEIRRLFSACCRC